MLSDAICHYTQSGPIQASVHSVASSVEDHLPCLDEGDSYPSRKSMARDCCRSGGGVTKANLSTAPHCRGLAHNTVQENVQNTRQSLKLNWCHYCMPKCKFPSFFVGGLMEVQTRKARGGEIFKAVAIKRDVLLSKPLLELKMEIAT